MTSYTSIPCSSSQLEVVHAHSSDRGSSTSVNLQNIHQQHEHLHKMKGVTEKRKRKVRLKVKHLSLLKDILKSVAHKFFVFGSEVKVEQDVLAGVSKGYYTFDEKLSRLLECRLQQVPLLTWHDIVRALRSPSVNEQVLASQIESQYIPCSSSQSQPVSDQSSTIDLSNPPLQAFDMQHHHHPYVSHTTPSSVSLATPQPLSHQSYPIPPQLDPHFQMNRQHNIMYSGSHINYGTTNHPSLLHPQLQPPRHIVSTQLPPGRNVTGKRSFSQLSVDKSQAASATAQLGPFHSHSLDVQQSRADTPSAKRPHLELDASLQVPHSNYDPKSLFHEFVRYVKTLYRSSPIEKCTEVLKLPTPGDVYINLACIDRKTEGLRTEYDEITEAMVRDGNVDVIEGRKCPIDMNKIALGLPATTLESVILVEGAPGVGKSTFAWEFCRRWERGEIAQQYDLVLLLRLRDESINVAKDWKDLVYHSSTTVRQAVISEIESRSGYGVLFILEGYDELPDECRHPSSPFLKLISGKDLYLATLMITSRPWATCDILKKFKNRVFQHIEVLGFTKQQIKSYVESRLSDEDTKCLEKILLRHPQIRMCMYIPLNCAIVVTVYQESKALGVNMPDSLTELYLAVSRTILLRYLHAIGMDCDPVEHFDGLPQAVKEKFKCLCELAYNGITEKEDHVKLIFSHLPPDFDNLGFMDSVYELYVTRRRIASHNFLHLTFQEFLAAVHISKMEHDKKLQHFKSHKEGKLRVVLRFLAGLTHLGDFNSLSDFINVMGGPDDTGDTDIDYSVSTQLSWVYESQRGDIVRGAFEEDETVEFICEDQFDSSALGYCVANSCCKWVLSIGRAIGEYDASIFVEEARRTHGTGRQIIGMRGERSDIIDFKCLRISIDALNIMFTELKMSMYLQELSVILPAECSEISWPDLSSLRVLNLCVSGKINLGLNSLLPHLSLTKLVFSGCNSSVEDTLLQKDCEAIANFVENNTSLEELLFSGEEDLDVDNLGIIFKGMGKNKSLPLQRLSLDGIIRLDNYDLPCLAEYIESSTTLKQLDFCYGIALCAMGALDLARALREKPDLCTNINFLCVVSGDYDVPSYVEMMSDFPEMIEWDGKITRDVIVDISDEGVVDLAEILEDRYKVTVFELSGLGIGNDAVMALAGALDSNSTLKELDLSDNEIDCDGVNALAMALKDNITLEILLLNVNKIGNDGAEALAEVLQSNSTLRTLNLSNNAISDDGIEAIARALYPEEPPDHVNDDRARASHRKDSSCNTALKELILSHNEVGDKGAMALSQALHRNSTLKGLTLYGNPGIGEEGVHHLIQALTVNVSIAADPSSDTGGLLLDKKNHERYAVNFPDYTAVKRKITFR